MYNKIRPPSYCINGSMIMIQEYILNDYFVILSC